jgi:hypothetical protein
MKWSWCFFVLVGMFGVYFATYTGTHGRRLCVSDSQRKSGSHLFV